MFRHGWKFLALLLIAGIAFLWLIKAPVISAYFSDKLGVPVTMRSISIWPKRTTISDFRIANPYGFKSKTAFKVEKTTIDYRWKAVFQTPSEIDQILMQDVFLSIELKNPTGSNNNWSAIGAGIPKDRGDKEVIVHKMILKNITVKIEGMGARILGVAGTKHFDEMEFNEINSKDGFPTKELVSQIFQGAGLLKYLDQFLKPVKEIKNALNPFNIFGENAPEEEPFGSLDEED